jgi:hypothetical protein
MVELVSGCRHMRCRCKAEFCYVCGARWRTCDCNGDEPVQNRPPVSADGAEQTETRAAVVAAEEMERREAAERRRAEIAARIAAERAAERARERVEREVRKKKMLVQAELTGIAGRYQARTREIEDACSKQSWAMAERHRKERADIVFRYRREIEGLIESVERTIVSLEAARDVGNETLNLRHANEAQFLQNRHEQEEDEYWFSLRTYLKGKQNAESRERVLIDRLKAQQCREMEELVGRQRQMALRRVEVDSWGVLKEVEARRDSIDATCGMAKITDSASVWVAERKWVVAVEDERKSRLLARRMEEEEKARGILEE